MELGHSTLLDQQVSLEKQSLTGLDVFCQKRAGTLLTCSAVPAYQQPSFRALPPATSQPLLIFPLPPLMFHSLQLPTVNIVTKS